GLSAASELASLPLAPEGSGGLAAPIARHARPRRLRRGGLLIEVDGAEWMHELQYLKHELRARLNARLGRATVRDLFLVLAGGGGSSRAPFRVPDAMLRSPGRIACRPPPPPPRPPARPRRPAPPPPPRPTRAPP